MRFLFRRKKQRPKKLSDDEYRATMETWIIGYMSSGDWPGYNATEESIRDDFVESSEEDFSQFSREQLVARLTEVEQELHQMQLEYLTERRFLRVLRDKSLQGAYCLGYRNGYLSADDGEPLESYVAPGGFSQELQDVHLKGFKEGRALWRNIWKVH